MVAISWRERAVLTGECTWGGDPATRQSLRQLIAQTLPKTVAALPAGGRGGRVIPALFTRMGATPDALALFREPDGVCVDLPTLYTDLAE